MSYTLDFDANGPGLDVNLDSSSSQPIDDDPLGGLTRLITDNGISWLLSTPTADGPALFDTTCPYGDGTAGSGCNGDADLRPLTGDGNISGNIFIQQNDNENRTPNDDPATDFLKLTLKSDVMLFWEEISVVDDGRYDFFINIGGVETNLGQVTLNNDSETAKVAIDAPLAMKMDDFILIDFSRPSNGSNGDSCGVDSLVFTVVPVPVPAGLPLLLGGLGALAWLKRRRPPNIRTIVSRFGLVGA